LWSKHRFLAAQFEAYLEDDLWLGLARHSNAMARRLADGFVGLPGVSLTHPVEANEIFPHLPEKVISGLEGDGFEFYRWPGPDPELVRLVTSFSTTVEEVDAFLASARKHADESERA
jgi:threonine aldolase